MTKNVALYTSTWHKMKNALTSLTGGGSHYGGYGGYGGYNGTSSQGFSKDIDKLVSISESAKRLIAEKDSDGVVSFRYHDERQTAQGLQGKLEALEKYSNHVSTYLKDKIDSPFYQAMDGVGAKLEALSIASYKTSNTIGYKRTDVLTDVYGHQLGTREVTPQEIGLEELYRVDNPYKKTLQASYQDFKNSDAYKDHKLTETEFLMASHHTRAFNYESIRDQQEAIEFWRDIALGVGVVVLTIFCPPAGVTVGVVLAGAEMYSAATGKDWGTGRELSDGERVLRGSFALFDLIPGAKYLHTVAKSGSVVAAKGLLKTSLKEGFEQGARNFDTGMKLLSRFGDNVLRQVDNFGRQADQLLNRALVSGADHLSAGLKTMDSHLSQAAQNFRLNMVPEPQLVSGVLPPSGSTTVDHLTSKLDDFSKAKKLRMAELDEVGDDTLQYSDAILLRDRIKGLESSIKIKSLVSSEETNRWWATQGYVEPPYTAGTSVQIIELTEEVKFVRVYDGENSGLYGGWLMKPEDIQGLTPVEIQQKFALPHLPKYVGEVTLPKGSTLRMGEVNPLFGFNGGGLQFDLMGQYIGKFEEIGLISK